MVFQGPNLDPKTGLGTGWADSNGVYHPPEDWRSPFMAAATRWKFGVLLLILVLAYILLFVR